MDSTERNIPASRRWIFPNAFDFIAMAVWVFLSQYIVVLISSLCGLQMPDLAAADSPDDYIYLTAQLDTARSIAVIYTLSMILAIAGIIGYRRLRGCKGRPAHLSISGLDPVLILGTFIWMLATQITTEPLLALLPDVPNSVGRGFFAVFTAVLLAPLFEEFLCRGIILESFRAKYGVVVAWIASSLFFAVIHGQITAMTNALIIGSILGYACIRSRSILSSTVLHAVNNCLALTAISFGYGNSTFSELIDNRNIYIGIYVVSAAVCIFGFAMLARRLAAERRREKYPVQE